MPAFISIAEQMMQVAEGGLPTELEQRLLNASELCGRVGTELASRQAIAVIVSTYIDQRSD